MAKNYMFIAWQKSTKEYYQLYLYEDEDIFSLSSSSGIYSKKHQKKIPFDFLLEYTL